jgi:hypothetical protein
MTTILRRTLRPFLCAGASLGFASVASAQKGPSDATGTYALSFVRGAGAESCPSRQELEREVSARLGHSPFDSVAPRSIEILTERTAEGHRSVVSVIDRDGKLIGRRVLQDDEPSCAAIFSATALAVALLIDPEAALSRDARANEAVASFEVDEPTRPPEPPPPSLHAASPPPTTAPAEVIVKPPAPPLRVVRAAVVGTDVAVAVGFVPGVSPAVGIFGAGTLSSPWGLSLSALYVSSTSVSEGDKTLEVSFTTFGAAVTLAVVSTTSFRLVPDAGFMVGALHVAVLEGQPADAGDHPYYGLGFGLRAEAAVIKGLFITVRAGGAVPFIRRELSERDAPTPIWRQPPVAGLASLGLGWAFF